MIQQTGQCSTVKMIQDSVAPNGVRVMTLELEYPRMIHAEFMTHRVFSRNAQSNRAIPDTTVAKMVLDNPAIPIYWGKKQRGMQAAEEIQDPVAAREWWLRARDSALEMHRQGMALGLHKQVLNRILEPFQLIRVIVTATDWLNFFALRDHHDAQPEIQDLARTMRQVIQDSTPRELKTGEWHLPYITEQDRTEALEAGHGDDYLCCVSTARCARVSYLSHDGVRALQKDLDLHNDLLASKHMSPFEHPCTPLETAKMRGGNLRGWKQHRQFVEVSECHQS